MNDGLKQRHRQTIIQILESKQSVERAVLFGSRAMQTFSPASDIDLMLFGDQLTRSDLAMLAIQIDETTIPQRVDLLLDKSIRDEELREHVRKFGIEWYRRNNDLNNKSSPNE